MRDEISRRPRTEGKAYQQGRYTPPQKAPLLFRILAQLSILAIFLAMGYYGSDLLFKLLDEKNVIKQDNVVSNAAELQKLLASDGMSKEALAGQKELTVYALSSSGLVRSTLKVMSDVQEDEIVQAVKAVFSESSESWANMIVPRHVYRDGITAFIDLPQGFAAGLGSMPEQRALLLLTGIVRTVVENFQPVKQVYFLQEGRWVPNAGTIKLSEPWGFGETSAQ
ncbi:MAG: GerMN domain-containing protein [Pyramidobacter sp.]